MSIYVERIDGVLDEGTFLIELLLTSLTEPSLQIKKSFESTFLKEESWGYDRYTRLTNIYECGFLSTDDTLIIKLSICISKYYETNKSLNKIIDQK
jgi:hypothetical protein